MKSNIYGFVETLFICVDTKYMHVCYFTNVDAYYIISHTGLCFPITIILHICTRDTATAAMRYLLDLPTMSVRYKLAQVKAFLRVSADTKHPLHDKVGRQVQSRLKRGTEWMNQAATTISECCEVEDIRKGCDWIPFEDSEGKFTTVEMSLGRECREWPEGEADAAVEALIDKLSDPDDVTVFTDGSVQRDPPTKSGWGLFARKDGITAKENSGATSIVTSSMVMEVKAITETLRWMTSIRAYPFFNKFSRRTI